MKLSATKVYIFFTVLTILLFSCQNDESEETQNTAENLQAGSELVISMARMTQYPTAADNIIDGTSCFAVNLPASVVVNGQQLQILSGADYVLIENIFGISSTDVDTIEVQFPVTVTLPDYTQLEINNQQEWNAAANCSGNDALGELSCIRFNYPITINTYDVINQIADVIVIDDNVDMYGFLETISDDLLASLTFPVRIINPQGSQVASYSNNQLLEVINQYAPQCSNDPAVNLDNILVDGAWYVSFFSENGSDMTGNYFGYNFAFNEDGSLLVTNNASVTEGEWNAYNDALNLKLVLLFSDNDLAALEEDWVVTEYTAGAIELKYINTGDGSTDILHLEKE